MVRLFSISLLLFVASPAVAQIDAIERAPINYKTAKADNVIMKVSGLGMCDPLWTVASIRPYVLGAIEAFGADRIVMGTNWPVDRMFSSYPDVINAYAEIISGFSRADQVKLFSGNAERIFRI